MSELVPSEPAWPLSHATAAGVYAGALHVARGPAARLAPASIDDELVQAQPFCVASSVGSSGTLGDTVLYRHRRHGDVLEVGYFVYWTTERPWGDNELTHRIYPALAIDAVYSHFMFVFPGVQRLLYGPGDVEGVHVRYRVNGDKLVPEHGVADNEFHQRVELSATELLAEDGRVIVLTDTWSHQLGGHQAVARAKPADVTCFQAGKLAPLTPEIANAFRLGSEGTPRRAKPAWRAVTG